MMVLMMAQLPCIYRQRKKKNNIDMEKFNFFELVSCALWLRHLRYSFLRTSGDSILLFGEYCFLKSDNIKNISEFLSQGNGGIFTSCK